MLGEKKQTTLTFPVPVVPGWTWYTAAMISCVTPQMERPVMRKTRRRPILEMTLLFTMMTKTPTEVKMHEFIKGLPTLAIYMLSVSPPGQKNNESAGTDLEEVRSVRNHKHSTRCGLRRYRRNSQQRASPIYRIFPDIEEIRA